MPKNATLRRGSRPHKLLKQIMLVGGILVLSGLSPQAGAQIARGAIGDYFKDKKFKRNIFLRDLKRLRERKIIDYQEYEDDTVKITLTRQGKEKTLRYKLDDIRLNTEKPWDGKWRLVTFDIPHSKKEARDALREKMRELRFYALQKSVFITPYPCEEEIDFIASIFEVQNNILILYVDKFEGEDKLRHFFKI